MMFPSSYNNSSGTYPCYPSSSSYPLFPFLNPENASSSNNTLLHDPLVVNVPYNIPTHHHHHNTHQIQETLTNNLPLSDAAAMHPKQDINIASHYGSISCLLTKKPAKKDRHSKIYTSQGLRDRRVRLSIEIARKFFDLQDMLGFDKASNTLEWLFNKSKKAIKDLARSKNSISKGSKSFSSSSSDCEEEDFEVVSNDALNLQQGLDCSDVVKERKMKRAQKELPACNVRAKMKESREKARARARERTSNKMCNNGRVQVQDLKKKCLANANHENPPQILHQLRSPLPVEDCARSSPNKMVQPHQPHHHLVMSSEGTRDDFNVIEESIVIKRKLKPSLMSSSHHHHHHHHQNLVIPKEASFNNNNSTDNYQPFPNLSPNWDANNGANNATGRSNFCAIASMNLSTGLQIFGKSWE